MFLRSYRNCRILHTLSKIALESLFWCFHIAFHDVVVCNTVNHWMWHLVVQFLSGTSYCAWRCLYVGVEIRISGCYISTRYLAAYCIQVINGTTVYRGISFHIGAPLDGLILNPYPLEMFRSPWGDIFAHELRYMEYRITLNGTAVSTCAFWDEVQEAA